MGTYVEGRLIVRGCGAMMAGERYRSCPIAEHSSPELLSIVDAHRRDMQDRDRPSAQMWQAVDVVAAARSERLAKDLNGGG